MVCKATTGQCHSATHVMVTRFISLFLQQPLMSCRAKFWFQAAVGGHESGKSRSSGKSGKGRGKTNRLNGQGVTDAWAGSCQPWAGLMVVSTVSGSGPGLPH